MSRVSDSGLLGSLRNRLHKLGKERISFCCERMANTYTSHPRQIASELSIWQERLGRAEAHITSQGSQDGVLKALFEDLGNVNHEFVEFGFNSKTYEGGSGANTLQLQRRGWHGLLMDGGYENVSIHLYRELLGPHGIVHLLQKHGVSKNVDYMSIDFDSFDLWVFRAVVQSAWRPRVLTVEYNPCFPFNSTLALQFPKEDSFWQPGDKVWGASLGALDLIARENGYTMVYVVTGLDAFFVRNDVLAQREVKPLSSWPPDRLVEAHYSEDGKWARYPRALTRAGRYMPLTLGGARAGYLMGWWSKKMSVDDITAREHANSLEDVSVYLHTKRHGEARKAASVQAYAKHILTRKWD